MEIRINGQVLNANLENEKTIGEVLSALEQWLNNSGHVLSGLTVDGQQITASMIENEFFREIDTVKILDIQTESLAALTVTSLYTLLDDISEYEKLDFEKKTAFFNIWEESACGRFIISEMPDLYSYCAGVFSRREITTENLRILTEERLREIKEPFNELSGMENAVNNICERLVDLPLDIQTGKDKQAAQTIHIFTTITEKIFRIFNQLGIQGYLTIAIEQKNLIAQQLTDFNNILKELLDAYERNDPVLVGDLAEYEASVRIKEIYIAILENCQAQNKATGAKND